MIYTGYYVNMNKAPVDGGYTFVAISRGIPSWFDKPLLQLVELMPSWELIDMAKKHDYEQYIRLYREKLAKVSLRDVLDSIPDNSILLCYEKPDKFCHRHIVRNWLNENGILCSELNF